MDTSMRVHNSKRCQDRTGRTDMCIRYSSKPSQNRDRSGNYKYEGTRQQTGDSREPGTSQAVVSRVHNSKRGQNRTCAQGTAANQSQNKDRSAAASGKTTSQDGCGHGAAE